MTKYLLIHMDQNTQENQYIPKAEDSGVDLFTELGSELDFGEVIKLQDEAANGKKSPLQWVHVGLGFIFKIAVVICIVTGVDVTARNLVNNDAIKSLPLCSYYAMGVDEYNNDDCASYTEILARQSAKKAELEKELAINLAVLIPQKLLLQNTIKSPEVQYILAKTSNSRVLIDEMFTKFTDYRTGVNVYKGDDIDCYGYTVDEKGNFTVTCDFLGFSISGAGDKVATSRVTALAFLDKIRSPESGFKIINEPKSLDMQVYSSADLGIRSTFTTKTTLTLKLRYSSPNRI